MCGIVGYIGTKRALPILLDGLSQLEYRGYDSAGVALIEEGQLQISRAPGRLSALKTLLTEKLSTSSATTGIGHTRWATHGKPSEANAHPHASEGVCLVHNGIIENHLELRRELEREGVVFTSETDTEVAAHLLAKEIKTTATPLEALKQMVSRLTGSYAFLALDERFPNRIFVAKTATPIIIGVGEGEFFLASDIPALLPYTRSVIMLEDGDIAELSPSGCYIERDGIEQKREIVQITWDRKTAEKGGFPHYMIKEIFDQVEVVSDALRERVDMSSLAVDLSETGLKEDQVKAIRTIHLVGCGTAWHACLVAKYLIESIAGIQCVVDHASEFRYRSLTLHKDDLVLAISQSGETADTLAALLRGGEQCRTGAICNVVGSTISRKADHVLFTRAGPEISVASTKAFTTQLVAAYLLATALAEMRGTLGQRREAVRALLNLPSGIDTSLKLNDTIETIADRYRRNQHVLFLGRGLCYPIALEGALKLKEISYIHAEGYPAGEIKHGPIALVDDTLPIVVLLQRQRELFDKTLSNLREVGSRGARIIAITDSDRQEELAPYVEEIVTLPFISHHLTPILMSIPLQLFAYHVAHKNGLDVDLPRNLAKSVTVE